MEDRQIIALYWERNPEAITRTQAKYGGYCAAVAQNILQSREDAEECVNDAWLAAWNSIPPKRPENLGAYLGRLTRSRAIDRWRALRREKRGGGAVTLALEELAEVISGGGDLEQGLLDRELAQAVNRFLGGLSGPERTVFLARYWYFEDVPGISRRFGFTESKVHSMLHRTRAKLRRFLQKEDLL